MIVVVGSLCPEAVFRYTMLFNALGHATLGVNGISPLLSCIQDPRSGLLLLEDGFVPKTSAGTLINQIRSTPGPKSAIPIIRVWRGPVVACGYDQSSVITVNGPVTGSNLERAMQSLGLAGEDRKGT